MVYSSPYLSAHQSRTRAPTDWEIALADTLMGIFARGTHDLDSILAELDGSPVRPPGGGSWTEANFSALMHELGA
jgi:hypothetical protein